MFMWQQQQQQKWNKEQIYVLHDIHCLSHYFLLNECCSVACHRCICEYIHFCSLYQVELFHGISWEAFVPYYRELVTRIQLRSGIEKPDVRIDLKQVEKFLKKKYGEYSRALYTCGWLILSEIKCSISF